MAKERDEPVSLDALLPLEREGNSPVTGWPDDLQAQAARRLRIVTALYAFAFVISSPVTAIQRTVVRVARRRRRPSVRQRHRTALQEGYRLLAAYAAGVEPHLGTALMARFLIARQRPAGDWSGLNQRPPSSSSDFAKTAIGVRAVQLFHHRADVETARHSVARAATWLRSHQAPDTEGRAYQLLGLHWTGSDSATRVRLARELIATQRSDGGWGSVEGRASEAYSTGEALFALHEAGEVATSDVNWQRGVAFLTRTQAVDGSWHVPSRLHDPARLSPPYLESGYPYGHDQFISVAGAAWAVMALAQALPPVAVPVEPMRPETRSTTVEPWVKTAVFGTVDELRELLDKGLSPNAATTAGKTPH